MVKVVFGFVLLIGCSSAFASCQRPAIPEIPDPSSAVTAQMVKAQNEVKAYISKAERYLSCERMPRERDDVAAEMESIAEKFNESIREYKARLEDA